MASPVAAAVEVHEQARELEVSEQASASVEEASPEVSGTEILAGNSTSEPPATQTSQYAGVSSSEMPSPQTIEKQKKAYLAMLDSQLNQGLTVLNRQNKFQKDYLAAQMANQKQAFHSHTQNELRQQETQISKQHQAQAFALQEQAAKQRLQLEQQALSLTLMYQQKKAEEEMLKQKLELEKLQTNVQKKLETDMKKLGIANMPVIGATGEDQCSKSTATVQALPAVNGEAAPAPALGHGLFQPLQSGILTQPIPTGLLSNAFQQSRLRSNSGMLVQHQPSAPQVKQAVAEVAEPQLPPEQLEQEQQAEPDTQEEATINDAQETAVETEQGIEAAVEEEVVLLQEEDQSQEVAADEQKQEEQDETQDALAHERAEPREE